jgi:hypothetical protein
MTGLNQTQIVNGTTNVRKRNRKATCDGAKNPHHFIDFLFLVHANPSNGASSLSSNETKETTTRIVAKISSTTTQINFTSSVISIKRCIQIKWWLFGDTILIAVQKALKPMTSSDLILGEHWSRTLLTLVGQLHPSHL